MAKRRGSGEGAIAQRKDGRWQARLSLPDGGRRYYYGATQAEAAGKLLKARTALSGGLPIPGDRLTLGGHLDVWLVNIEPEVRYGTWRRYEEAVRLYLKPALGSVALTKLTPDQVRQFLRARLEAGMAPATVQRLRATLRLAIQQAVRDEKVLRNVAALTRPVKLTGSESGTDKTPGRMKTLTRQQAVALLGAAAGDRLEAIYWLALSTGMRRGELLGLKWRDVDLERATLRVVGTLQRSPTGLTVSEPKTDQSRRTIQLVADAVKALRRHKARQGEERMHAGGAWASSGLVFANEIGGPIEAGNLLRRSFWPILAKVGLADRIVTLVERKPRKSSSATPRRRREKPAKVELVNYKPHLRFHDLRHTAATLLLEDNVHPSVVAAMLGHSKTSTTLNIYSHVTPSIMGAATKAMASILGA